MASSSTSSSLYQKYRPIQLRDMIGQENVRKVLSAATLAKHFTHAYMFGGQHGSGKTSAARILAATMVCPNSDPDGEPCGVCKVCTAIHDGHCVDVYEMDGADKRKIEDVRKIIETCHYPPQELKRKVYILDEVHALTGEASSALLKTMEEPPDYVTFILCTTDIRKIKGTIMSRCQRLHFNKIPAKEMAGRLMAVANREGFSMEEAASLAIARSAKGSMRDALGDLERISTAENGNITLDATMSHLGVADHRIMYHMVKMMAEGNIPEVLGDIDLLIKSSVEAKVVLQEVCEIFRNMVVIDGCGKNSDLLDLMEDEKDMLEQIVKKIGMSKAMYISSKISSLGKDFSSNIHERLVLEAAVIQGLKFIQGSIVSNTQKQT